MPRRLFDQAVVRHNRGMGSEPIGPFSYAELKPYAVPGSLDELEGPEHGLIWLPHHLAWSGRREFDLDDDYDRAALYKVVLEEGQQEDVRRFLSHRILRLIWSGIVPARQVRGLWERRFPELRRAA